MFINSAQLPKNMKKDTFSYGLEYFTRVFEHGVKSSSLCRSIIENASINQVAIAIQNSMIVGGFGIKKFSNIPSQESIIGLSDFRHVSPYVYLSSREDSTRHSTDLIVKCHLNTRAVSDPEFPKQIVDFVKRKKISLKYEAEVSENGVISSHPIIVYGKSVDETQEQTLNLVERLNSDGHMITPYQVDPLVLSLVGIDYFPEFGNICFTRYIALEIMRYMDETGLKNLEEFDSESFHNFLEASKSGLVNQDYINSL